MPLTEKGKKIKRNMMKHYGKEKGEQVFYASENKGTITGVAKRGKIHGSDPYTDDDVARGYRQIPIVQKIEKHLEKVPIVGPAIKALSEQRKRVEDAVAPPDKKRPKMGIGDTE